MYHSLKPYGQNVDFDHFYTSQNMREQNRTYTIQVDGSGSVTAQPDQAEVTLGVIVEDMEVQKAQQQNTFISNQVIETLNKMGIEEDHIETTSYSIDQMYDYPDGKKTFRGYKVIHMFKITIDEPDKVGAVIDTAVKNGANDIKSIEFTISNPEIYYEKALRNATLNAKSRAKKIGDTLGLILDDIPLWIIDKGSSLERKTITGVRLGSSTPIQEGDIKISSSIQALYHYRNS